MFALVSRFKQPTNAKGKETRSAKKTRSTHAPHAIPEGMEDAVCPVTGLSLEGHKAQMPFETAAALTAMENDPDILEERLSPSKRVNTLNVPMQNQDKQITAEDEIKRRLGRSPRRARDEHQDEHHDEPKPSTKTRPKRAQDETRTIAKTSPKVAPRRAPTRGKDETKTRPLQPFEFVPLNVRNASHQPTIATQRLVRSVGLKKLREFTEAFYAKVFVDPHLDKFIRKHDDPHGERFALWIAEKFGDGTPWTEERKTRPKDVMRIGKEVFEVAHDRSSAHFAAWHSPKREAHKWGQHFQPDDARVWMRLHFWAAREVGLFEPRYASFMDYYIRFIAHFVSVYSGKSPPFTRESARWSADPKNISRYVKAGRLMIDVVDVPIERALTALPAEEREYTGSKHPNPSWPYQNNM